MKNKIYISWEIINTQIDSLSKLIKKDSTIEYIYGIPRGGLIPAIMLSHKTNIPLILNIDSTPLLKTLIIDDIADSGETISPFLSVGVKVATLYLSESCKSIPTYYITKLGVDQWVQFPWENNNSEMIQDYKK